VRELGIRIRPIEDGRMSSWDMPRLLRAPALRAAAAAMRLRPTPAPFLSSRSQNGSKIGNDSSTGVPGALEWTLEQPETDRRAVELRAEADRESTGRFRHGPNRQRVLGDQLLPSG
jgi:hypothetical protein